ncbi:hypothetical protein ACIA9I_34615 [Streptomyces anulatus]
MSGALGGCSPGGSGPAGVDAPAAVARAYVFLDPRVDEAAGAVQGLPRSYTGGYMERHHFTVAFT